MAACFASPGFVRWENGPEGGGVVKVRWGSDLPMAQQLLDRSDAEQGSEKVKGGLVG